jgi:hypothetical protein
MEDVCSILVYHDSVTFLGGTVAADFVTRTAFDYTNLKSHFLEAVSEYGVVQTGTDKEDIVMTAKLTFNHFYAPAKCF